MGRIRRTVAATAALLLLGIAVAAPASADHGGVTFSFSGLPCAGQDLIVAIDGDEVASSPFSVPPVGIVVEFVNLPETVTEDGTNVLSVECFPSGLTIASQFDDFNIGPGDANSYTTSPDLVLAVSAVGEVLGEVVILGPEPEEESSATLGGRSFGNRALAQTGSESLPLVQQGLGLIALGGLILFAARRRRIAVTTSALG